MTATRMRFLCESCAEGLGLELDGAKLVRAVCAMCGQRCNCIVAIRPTDEGNGENGYEKDCGTRNRGMYVFLAPLSTRGVPHLPHSPTRLTE